MSILDVNISCFKNYHTSGDPKEVNLLAWLKSDKYANEIKKIRKQTTKADRDKIKAGLPAITPSGIFTYRSQSNFKSHSGFIQFDIDFADENKEIKNWKDLKEQLTKIKNIAYCGLSASGNGYWGLIPIPKCNKDIHKEYFKAIEADFKALNIQLDEKPSSISSLRGYSWDDKAYFNHNAITYTKRKQEPKPQFKPIPQTRNTTNKNIDLTSWIIDKMQSAIEGDRHETRLKMARYAGGLVGGGHLDYNILESLKNAYLNQYSGHDSKQVIDKELRAIEDGYKHGQSAPIYELDFLQKEDAKPLFQNVKIEQPKPKQAPKQFYSFDEYVNELKFENNMLMAFAVTKGGYPANWDIHAKYINDKTKAFTAMAEQNPNVLKLANTFDLQMIN